MAIFSLNHSTIGRSTHLPGTSSAHARYIMRESAMTDHAEHLPEGVEPERESVSGWLNEQERGDRVNARVIDKIRVALPRELTPEQRQELVRAYCDDLTGGRAPYLAAIHAGPADADNPHAHIILRDRDLENGKRVLGTSEKGSTDRFREKWEEHTNRALDRAGRPERVDRRTLAEQGIHREPEQHRGPNVEAMERKQIPTERMAEASIVREYNDNLLRFREEKARLDGLHKEKREQARSKESTRRKSWDMRGAKPLREYRSRAGNAEALRRERRTETATERERFWTHRQAHAVKSLEDHKKQPRSLIEARRNWDYWRGAVRERSKHPIDLMFSQKDRNTLRYAQRREFDAMVTYRTRTAYEAIKDYAGKAVDLAKQEITRLREAPSRRRTVKLLQQGYWDREGARARAIVERLHKHPLSYVELRENLARTSAQVKAILAEQATLTKEAAEAGRKLGTLARLEGQWRRADAAVRQLESPADKAKRLFSDHARQSYMSATMQRERVSAEYWRLVKGSGLDDATQLKSRLTAVRSEAETRIAGLERRGKTLEHRLRIYQSADDAFARQAEARLSNDPEIKRRHEERLSSGRWDLEYSRALRVVEAHEGRPLTQDELQRLARGKDWNAPEARAWLGQQRAQELQEYQAQTKTDPAARNRELEQRLRVNRREAMADLRPTEYQRLLERERDADVHRHIHTRHRPH